MRSRPSETAKVALYCILSNVLLFCGFFNNCWHVADQQLFVSQNYDTESLVVGRMVKSRQDGIFSAGGLTGLGIPDGAPADFEKEAFRFQYQAYMNGLTFGSFVTYQSQIGGQGILFSILDGLMHLSPQTKLQMFRAFTSLLSAFTVTMIALWFYWEFGLLVSSFVLASAVLSSWLAVFGGKLWWSMWSWYLPIVVLMYHLKNTRPTNRRHLTFGVLVFIVIFVKCFFTGYEYITTTFIMMMAPFVYYGMLDRLSFRALISGSLTAAFSSSLAILVSLTILSIQIASVEGSLLKGVDHIAYALQKRTYADPSDFPSVYAASLDSSTATVLVQYLAGDFFDAGNYLATSNEFVSRFVFRIRYLYLIFLFAIASVFLYAFRNRRPDREKAQGNLALVSATWFSLLAPLSWFVIFKAHSYIHAHLNNIVWQMPFTLFGFALCGLVLKHTRDCRRSVRTRPIRRRCMDVERIEGAEADGQAKAQGT